MSAPSITFDLPDRSRLQSPYDNSLLINEKPSFDFGDLKASLVFEAPPAPRLSNRDPKTRKTTKKTRAKNTRGKLHRYAPIPDPSEEETRLERDHVSHWRNPYDSTRVPQAKPWDSWVSPYEAHFATPHTSLSDITQSGTIHDEDFHHQRFVYSTLPEGQKMMRLLHLLPAGDNDDIIRCRLVKSLIVDRNENSTQYDALSYTWGSNSLDFRISISREEDGRLGFLPVTENLFRALRRLRYDNRTRTLWVDAICIDQSNGHERSHQVELMKRIYEGARRVIVWLGDAESDHSPPKPRNRLSKGSFEDWLLADLEQALSTTEKFWWERIWTIQEFAFARKTPLVRFGGSEVEWPRFETLVNMWGHETRRLGQDEKAVIQSLSRAIVSFKELRESRGTLSLSRLSLLTASTAASDPRDKVYALLGLVEHGRLFIEPDYAKTAEHVFAEATYRIIEGEGNLNVLRHVQPRNRRPGLPSWVVDFGLRWTPTSASIGRYPYDPDAVYPSESWRANGWSRTADKPTFQDGELVVSGIQLDRIRSIVKIRSAIDQFSEQQIAAIGSMLEAAQQTRSRPSHQLIKSRRRSQRLSEARTNRSSLRLLPVAEKRVQDVLRSSSVGDAVPKIFALYRQLLARRKERCEAATRPFVNIRWWQYGQHGAGGCVFFTTYGGLLGLAPASIDVGDVILLSSRSSHPLVLRNDHKDRYSFRGLAYVDGLMEGQLARPAERLVKECPALLRRVALI